MWFRVFLIASPAIPLLGVGVLSVQSRKETLVALLPFILVAFLAVVVVWAVDSVREGPFELTPTDSQSSWPRTPRGLWVAIALVALLPLASVTGALIAISQGQWLAAAVVLAAVTPTTVLHVVQFKVVRQRIGDRHSPQD